MLKVNTIHSLSYNTAEREKFCDLIDCFEKEIQALENKDDEMFEQLNNEDYDVWEKQYEQERDKLYDKRRNAWINAFAAQFPKTRNEWFTNVIKKFVDEGKASGETFHISAKQYEYFSRYCCHEDDNKEAWECYKTYCRCCGCLITLKRPRHGGYYMEITILTA